MGKESSKERVGERGGERHGEIEQERGEPTERWMQQGR